MTDGNQKNTMKSTIITASAGTGKTYTIAGLVTRYVAEGHAPLERLLVVTFGRAATSELRTRVRERLLAARDGHRLPPVRCGVATGPVAHVQGDVYGPPVDLASRLTDLAAPGTIWLPAYAAAGLAGVRDEGAHRVKGLADALVVSSLTT